MAIPDNLYKLELSGRWEVGAAPDITVIYRWAMTWYVQSTVVTDEPNALLSYVRAYRGWYFSDPGPGGILAAGVVVDKERCVRVASGIGAEDLDDHTPPGANFERSLPAQVACLVIGRTNKLGVQTRKWIPCIAASLLEFEAPIWPTQFVPNVFTDWARGSLLPQTPAPATITPVVWNEKTEELHAITEIVMAPLPRTIRRRSLSEPFPLVELWP